MYRNFSHFSQIQGRNFCSHHLLTFFLSLEFELVCVCLFSLMTLIFWFSQAWPTMLMSPRVWVSQEFPRILSTLEFVWVWRSLRASRLRWQWFMVYTDSFAKLPLRDRREKAFQRKSYLLLSFRTGCQGVVSRFHLEVVLLWVDGC